MAKPNIQKDTVLIRPRVTEKAALSTSDQNVYVFEVTKDATKHSISSSVKRIYNLTPEKVRVLPIPRKSVFVRGKSGVKSGGRKAYVYLRKGDKININ